jgi:hypothetical protein
MKYHFIHIPKNGGQSVRAALARRGDVSLTRPLHARYVDVVDDVGTDLKYFCIIRNPWSRTASRYLFARQDCRNWPFDDPRRVYIERATFRDFVTDQMVFEIPEHPGQPWMGPMNSWFDQLEWIVDKDRTARCQCLRLECLETDLEAYFGEAIRVPRENKTRTPYDYRSMYTDELREIVGSTFAEDISHFGFTFETSATRNIVQP